MDEYKGEKYINNVHSTVHELKSFILISCFVLLSVHFHTLYYSGTFMLCFGIEMKWNWISAQCIVKLNLQLSATASEVEEWQPPDSNVEP